jgi:hypothetical protein
MLSYTLWIIKIIMIDQTGNLSLNSFSGCAPKLLQPLSDITCVNKH